MGCKLIPEPNKNHLHDKVAWANDVVMGNIFFTTFVECHMIEDLKGKDKARQELRLKCARRILSDEYNKTMFEK